MLLGDETGASKDCKTFSFCLFRSSPAVTNLRQRLKEHCQKTNGRDGYLRRVLGATLRDKVHRSEISIARDVKSLLRIERSQLHWFAHVSRMPQERWVGHVLLDTPWKAAQRSSRTRWPDYISDHNWSHLGVDTGKLRWLLIVRHIKSS